MINYKTVCLFFILAVTASLSHAQRRVIVTNEVDTHITNTPLNPVPIEGTVDLRPGTEIGIHAAIPKQLVTCMTNFNVARDEIVHTLRCRLYDGVPLTAVPEGFEFAFTTLGIHSLGFVENDNVEINVSFGPQTTDQPARVPVITDIGAYSLFAKLPGENVQSFHHPITIVPSGQRLVVGVRTASPPSGFSAYTIIAKGFMVPTGTSGIAF